MKKEHTTKKYRATDFITEDDEKEKKVAVNKEKAISLDFFKVRSKIRGSQYYYLQYLIRDDLEAKKTYSEWEKLLSKQ